MRFCEIMEQEVFHKDHQDAIPGAHGSGPAGNPDHPNNYYHKYRLGIAMAGSPEHLENVTCNGPASDQMVTIAYSAADRDIIDRAHTKMGYKKKRLSSPKSQESDTVQKQSPVPKKKSNQYGV